MGFFDFFKKPSSGFDRVQPQVFSREEVIKEQCKQMPLKPLKEVSFDFNAMFGQSDEISALNRKATTLAGLGKLNEAVACLKKVVELSKTQIQKQPTDGIRLALYLQKAGRGREAIKEMELLIAMVPAAVNTYLAHGKPASATGKASFEAEQYAVLFDKLRLIAQREGMKKQTGMYRQLAQQWRDRSSAIYQQRVMKMKVAVPARPVHRACEFVRIV